MSFYSQFAEFYERIFPFREPTYAFLRSHLPAGGRVLDVGCGTGHYCGRLAEDGYQVVGIDLDPAMIRQAQLSYEAPEFRTLDMLELQHLDGEFDAAFCVGNVAAHAPADALDDFLATVRTCLRPGGVWLVQTVNFDPLRELESFSFPVIALADGQFAFHREYRDITAERLRFLTRLQRDTTTVFSGEVALHPVRSADYIRRHEGAGFGLIGHWADFQGTPFSSEKRSGSVYAFRREP